MKKEGKKTFLFFGGALLAGISLYYFNTKPMIMIPGVIIAAYLIIKALD